MKHEDFDVAAPNALKITLGSEGSRGICKCRSIFDADKFVSEPGSFDEAAEALAQHIFEEHNPAAPDEEPGTLAEVQEYVKRRFQYGKVVAR